MAEACQALGIDPLPVLISECAWRYDNAPNVDLAMQHIDEAARFYNDYPYVMGVALWYLGGDDIVQQYIAPVTDYTITTVLPDPEPPDPPDPPAETLEQKLWRISIDEQVLELNAQAAIQGAILADGYVPVSGEYWTDYEGTGYAAQGAEHLAGRPRRVYYARVNDWDNVIWFTEPDTTPPDPGDPLDGLVLGPLFNQKHAITSPFNSPRSYGLHEGVDLDIYTAETNSLAPVLNGYGGVVSKVGLADGPYYNYVVVEHTYNGKIFRTWYCHLDMVYVSFGQRVAKGEHLGEIGETGNANGEHLHFNLQAPGFGLDGYYIPDVLDPEPYLTTEVDVPPPVTGDALFGIHVRADHGHFITNEHDEIAAARPDLIKVMSYTEPSDIAVLGRDTPARTWIVRAFLSFKNRAEPVTPEQFVEWTIGDVRRTVDAIPAIDAVFVELHNEPNLGPDNRYTEGLGVSWASGTEFSPWISRVLALYRAQLARDVRYIFPGLSPGASIAGIRQDNWSFIEQCRPAIAQFDALGIHVYWRNGTMAVDALAVVQEYINRFPAHPIWVTEVSNNKEATATARATQYITFWNEMKRRNSVQGMTYYLSSGSDYLVEAWVAENGVRSGIGELVGAR
jgi:murein DD-endopeptidase MepM/ murein hydrolase activator NlpD